MSSALSYQRVKEHLESLKLPAALAELDAVLEQAQKEQKLAVEVLDELLAHELRQRFERRITANLQLSGLPFHKRLEDYDPVPARVLMPNRRSPNAPSLNSPP
jgi:hypothetical protein